MNPTDQRACIGLGARVAEIASAGNAEVIPSATQALVDELLNGTDVPTALQRFVAAYDEANEAEQRWQQDQAAYAAQYQQRREQQDAQIRAIVSAVACSHCESEAGRHCITSGGYNTDPHAPRRRTAKEQQR